MRTSHLHGLATVAGLVGLALAIVAPGLTAHAQPVDVDTTSSQLRPLIVSIALWRCRRN